MRAALVAICLTASACASTPVPLVDPQALDLGTEEQVVEWIRAAGPFGIMMALADIEKEFQGDGQCPAYVGFGPTSHWHGGCEDWVGSRHEKRTASQVRVRLNGFGQRRPSPTCPGLTIGETLSGELRIWLRDGETHLRAEVWFDVISPGPDCAPLRTRTGIDYEARIAGDSRLSPQSRCLPS